MSTMDEMYYAVRKFWIIILSHESVYSLKNAKRKERKEKVGKKERHNQKVFFSVCDDVTVITQ